MKIFDISQPILSCQVYPGDPVPKSERLASIDEGNLYNLTAFSMCAHNGTHVDAPFHFIGGGKTVDQIPLNTFVGFCCVMEHDGEMTGSDARRILQLAADHSHDGAKRILIKGDSVITEEAAKEFAKEKILLLGVESQSVGPMDAPMAVHRILLEREIVLLEGIRLSGILQGHYLLYAAPINIEGADGAPCRAILIDFQ
ncbi:MAG: cyclase family protein [Oscillospiraceae bacterium]|nr:cyclase family protein [Oscillospiraceae bacterium]